MHEFIYWYKRHSTIEPEGKERKNLSQLVSLIAVDVVEKLECMDLMLRRRDFDQRANFFSCHNEDECV